MTHLHELICTNLLQSMESDVSSLDVHRVLHQPANAHCEARTHTILIADTGSCSYPDHASPAHLAAAELPAARVDCVLSRIPRYAGAGHRSGREYFHWNPVNTFVLAIEVQLAAMQGDRSQRAIGSSAVLGFLRNQRFFYRQRNPVSLPVPTAVALPGNRAYVQFRGAIYDNTARGYRAVNLWCFMTPSYNHKHLHLACTT
eukprot:6212093-Pleurochrysis_carterae.AAC.2